MFFLIFHCYEYNSSIEFFPEIYFPDLSVPANYVYPNKICLDLYLSPILYCNNINYNFIAFYANFRF